MLIILSPAKSLDISKQELCKSWHQPHFQQEAKALMGVLKKMSPKELSKLMKISPKLANLNWTRFKEWKLPSTPQNSKQAIFCFKGDVYTGLNALTLTPSEINFAQDHLRILSGLYGSLSPLDLIQPYRLEMGSKLKLDKWGNLYEFWGDSITNVLNDYISSKNLKYLINLASHEYFKVIHPDKINARIITPVFKEYRNGQYKFFNVFGKKARGLMTRFIIQNKITKPKKMKLFDLEGYSYNEPMSNGNEWIFTRG